MGRIVPRHHVGYPRLLPKSTLGRLTSEKTYLTNFLELRYGEVRAQGRAGKAGIRSDRGNPTRGYSSTNSSKGTPYALAIFVTVGM